MTKTLNRRRFLAGSLAATGGLAAFGGLQPLRWLARAAGVEGLTEDRYFVFCYFNGGWDALLSLDPRDPALFHGGNVKNTFIDPGYERIEDYDMTLSPFGDAGAMLGPFLGDLLGHLDKVAIIRGMSMDTLTHEVGRRRFLTGKPPSGLLARGSSGATLLASALGQGDAIPNLAMRVESYNTDQPNYASGLKVSTVSDLVRALAPDGPQLSAVARQQIDELLGKTALCPEASQSAFWQTSESSRGRAAEMVAKQLHALFDFMAPTNEMIDLRDHYGIANANQAQTSPGAQAALAAQALKGGVSRVVSIQATAGLDTHYEEWADDQGPTQMDGFNAVARLMDDLAASPYKDTGDSWLDHTTIVGFSEFQRGALINAAGGRDHSLTNACFVAGAGIKAGQVIGRSSDIGMGPTPTNLTSGQWDPAGEIIKPEHVLQTLMVDIGLEGDPGDLRVDPIGALLKG
jgi:hypothetical protein